LLCSDAAEGTHLMQMSKQVTQQFLGPAPWQHSRLHFILCAAAFDFTENDSHPPLTRPLAPVIFSYFWK
jgi:hypothetical protein